MNLRPVLDNLLVEHLPPNVFKQAGGLVFLPNRIEGQPEYAKVIAMGPGRANEYGHTPAPICQVGDYVALYPKAGHPVALPGQPDRWVIQPGNVMGVVEGVEA